MSNVIHVDFAGEVIAGDIIEIPNMDGFWKVTQVREDGLVVVERP